MARVGGRGRLEAPLVIVASVDHLERLRHRSSDLARDLSVARPGDHHAAPRVRDDRLELGRR